MIDISLTSLNLSPVTRAMLQLPGIYRKAAISAMKSLGFFLREEVIDYIETSGDGSWAPVHPLTKTFRKKYRRGNRWFKRSKAKAFPGPLNWFVDFVRYRPARDGSVVQVTMGKSRRGQPGRPDPELFRIVKDVQRRRTVSVTPKMRKFFGTTRRKRPKKQDAGKTFFPLDQKTTTLDFPARPIFLPVFQKNKSRIAIVYQQKLFSAFRRQLQRTGGF